MYRWIQKICILVSILLISSSALALVPVDQATQGKLKKQDYEKASKSGEKKEKAEIKDKDKGKKEKQEKEEPSDRQTDE